jgi:hypothetical protein
MWWPVPARKVPDKVELLASATSVGTGGDTVQLTAFVKDANNNTLPQTPVTFTTTTGTLEQRRGGYQCLGCGDGIVLGGQRQVEPQRHDHGDLRRHRARSDPADHRHPADRLRHWQPDAGLRRHLQRHRGRFGRQLAAERHGHGVEPARQHDQPGAGRHRHQRAGQLPGQRHDGRQRRDQLLPVLAPPARRRWPSAATTSPS